MLEFLINKQNKICLDRRVCILRSLQVVLMLSVSKRLLQFLLISAASNNKSPLFNVHILTYVDFPTQREFYLKTIFYSRKAAFCMPRHGPLCSWSYFLQRPRTPLPCVRQTTSQTPAWLFCTSPDTLHQPLPMPRPKTVGYPVCSGTTR